MRSYLLTKKGYELLKKYIRRGEKRLSQAIRLKSEAGVGQDGWHDEGFKLGIAEEMMWSKRLGELEKVLFNAQLVQPREQSERVEIGVGVVIKDADGVISKYIVDGYLAEPEKKRISVYSPLGKALLGAREGEERTMVIGRKERTFIIEKIFPPSVAEEKILNDKEDV
ncbi:MAG: GreA/GreB family elongation factor [Candidatus Omnitrophica bacterium]|nr:GreA/GreB family elongation factor [Candidatus Omnitrophota bacterium]